MVLTDKLLSETLDEAQRLPQSLQSSSGRLSQAAAAAAGAKVLL